MARNDVTHIDHVPTENQEEVAAQVRDWIRAHAFMGFKDEYSVRALDEYKGDNLYLSLGGYVTNPAKPTRQVPVESTFSVHVDQTGLYGDIMEDPEGTWWYMTTVSAAASWPSYGSQPAPLARLCASLIDATVRLAEMFDERFKDVRMWTRGTSKEERDKWALDLLKEGTRLQVAAAIREAIHTTCKGMRVGNQNFIDAPEGAVPGTYEVALERKEYSAYVNDFKGMSFKRTK